MKSIEEQAKEYVNQEKTSLRELSTLQKIALKLHLIAFTEKLLDAKQKQINKLKSALEDAIIGLEWEIDNTPERDHKADEEKIIEWKELINSLKQ